MKLERYGGKTMKANDRYQIIGAVAAVALLLFLPATPSLAENNLGDTEMDGR